MSVCPGRVRSVIVAALAGALLVAAPHVVLAQSGTPPAAPLLRWPVRTMPHVDLWLHAFALLSDDSASVPIYRRHYRDSLTVVKNRRNVLTSLDGNRVTLQNGIRNNGYIQAQFLPFEFTTWEEMRTAGERFLQVGGDPRRANDRETQMKLASFANVFPSAADREWLRLFLTSVQDEQERFFGAEVSGALRTRSAVVTAVDSLWTQVYRSKFERFLNNTSQRQGDMLLSLPIGGEGRTGANRMQRTLVAVPFPERVEDALQSIYVLAHEVTGTLVNGAVTDNTTPAEQRSGAAERYVTLGQVQAGDMLLTHVAPELRDGYQRFYLAQVGAPAVPAGDTKALQAAFDARFVLSAAIRDALKKQIDIVLAGI
jgi:hypothetical protein